MRTDPSCRPSLLLPVFTLLIMFSSGLSLAGGPVPELACPSCDDWNFCTIDSCDTTTGTCRHQPRDCADSNPCTNDSCLDLDGIGGQCNHVIVPAGTSCNDNNPCTQADACQASGLCVGAPVAFDTPCDDGNGCTESDTCSASGLCAGTALSIGSPCDDQNACTSGDTCLTLGAGPLVCVGSTSDCSDSDACSQDLCDPGTGLCSHPPVSCDDGNPCTEDSCDAATGQCLRTAVTGSCNDGNICTINDACSAGNCVGGGPRDCADFFSCTEDRCDPSIGGTGCWHIGHNELCPPPSPCAVYICTGCTSPPGYCNAGCFNTTPLGTGNCDHNFCTFDFCLRGACIVSNPTTCNDSNPCTTDACVPSTGACSFTPNNASCSDGKSCTTGDFCSNGVCQGGQTLSCDDGNACTTDSCGAASCEHTAANCDDSNPCTADSCDAASGCTHAPVSGGQTSCGVGACLRMVSECADGVPQTCVPGAPTDETCNSIDDDCDGLVDEIRVQADCTVNPATINLSSQGSIFSLTCKLNDVCDPQNPTPISGSTVSQVYISRIDSAQDPADDVTLPDPATLPCPDPVLGSTYERGISENLAARDVSNANVTFKFNLTADGECSTLDGDRQDIAARLVSIPDNTSATICISGKTGGSDFQTCVLVLVKNKGLR